MINFKITLAATVAGGNRYKLVATAQQTVRAGDSDCPENLGWLQDFRIELYTGIVEHHTTLVVESPEHSVLLGENNVERALKTFRTLTQLAAR